MNLNKLKDRYTIKTKLEGNERVLKSEIENDKGRGVNTEKKEEKLSKLKDNIKNVDNNTLEKTLSSDNKKVEDKEDNSTSKLELDEQKDEKHTEEIK